MMSKFLSNRRNLIISGVVAVLIGITLYYIFASGEDEGIVYEPVVVVKDDITVTILSTGTVQPETRLDIRPPISGRAEEVLVDEGEVVKKGQILAWMSSSERAAMLDSVRAKGPEELAKWEDLYRPTPILTPIDGTIIQRNVEPGQTFSNGDSIFVMSDHLIIEAQVDETDIASVKLGDDAMVILDAYPTEKIPAKIRQIAFESRVVNNVTTYIVKVLPDSVPDFMRAGMTANVNFHIASKKGVLVVPNDVITIEDGKRKVLMPGKNAPAVREIETGLTDGRKSEVVSGLLENDTILIERVVKKSSGSSSSPFGMPRMRKRGGGGGSRP